MTRAAVRERAQARREADAAFREAFDAYMFECFAKPGFKLESESQLAERFGVTRYKVRKAIEALNQAGVLERVKHGGSTVKTVRIWPIASIIFSQSPVCLQRSSRALPGISSAGSFPSSWTRSIPTSWPSLRRRLKLWAMSARRSNAAPPFWSF